MAIGLRIEKNYSISMVFIIETTTLAFSSVYIGKAIIGMRWLRMLLSRNGLYVVPGTSRYRGIFNCSRNLGLEATLSGFALASLNANNSL